MRRARVHAEFAFPFAGERDFGLVAEHEVELVGRGLEAAVGFGLEDANGHDVFAGPQDAVADGLGAGVFDPGARANPAAIDLGGVHALDDAE